MKENSKKVIGLVDTSILLHTIRQARKSGNFAEELISYLRALKLATGVDEVYCIGDSGFSTYRKNIYPDYKGQRAETHRKLEPNEKLRLEAMRDFNKNLYKFNDVFFYRSISGVECDDVIGILYNELTSEGYDVLALSQDKDFYTAIKAQDLFDIKTGKGYNVETKLKGLSQTKFKMFLTLNGDAIDFIIGFTGEKTALILVNNFKTFKAMQDFDLDNVLDLEGVTTKNKHHIVKALNAIKEDVDLKKIKLNWELISIFTDRSKLTEKQEREFERLKQDLLSWKPNKDISDDLELYLYEIGDAGLMEDLEWGI